MAEGIENIGKRDVVWSYAATIFTVGAGVILLPFILHQMSAQTVGIWNIFQTITSLVILLDFGFRPSFARNISYIFSGVHTLQKEGVEFVNTDSRVDYALLNAALTAMRRFYRWMAVAVFLLLAIIGTAYFLFILRKYNGDSTDALVAWILLVTINCYNLYTFYYDALLTGKGYVKRTQQITILGQSIYLIFAIILIYAGFGLSAIVSAQLLSIVIRRIIAKRVFFTPELKQQLDQAGQGDSKSVMQAITPNAVKVGLTHLGGFCVNKSAVLIGSAYLSLEAIASYGVTMQVMAILSHCAVVLYTVYTPRFAQCRAEKNLHQLRQYYTWSTASLILIFLIGGIAWITLGDWALSLIDSKTGFIPARMLLVALLIGFLEQNHVIAAGFIMADNRIPFFIPSLLSGAATILLLWVFLQLVPQWGIPLPEQWGIWSLILAPGIAQLAYQNWRWPSLVIRELKNA